MVSVMLGAVLVDRRGLSLRTVALSAVILLLWRPEELLEPGFQLSYAATVVLIWGFGVLDARMLNQKLPRWMTGVYLMVLSSVLAGAATAPYAAAHFNRFTDYGLVANLLTAPAMSFVMGAGAVAALLAPFGLEGVALWVMGLASQWILAVAQWVAGLDGAVTPIVAPGPWPLPLITLAGLWLVLWRGWGRLLALAPALVGLALWVSAERPVLLISDDGRLVGLLTSEGRALSQTRGAGFAAETWLENDGDLAPQAAAAKRSGFEGPRAARRFEVAGLAGISLTGKSALEGLAAACASADLVIVSAILEGPAPAGCQVVDARLLGQSGALSGWVEAGELVLLPARSTARTWRGAAAVLAPLHVQPKRASGPPTIDAPDPALGS